MNYIFESFTCSVFSFRYKINMKLKTLTITTLECFWYKGTIKSDHSRRDIIMSKVKCSNILFLLYTNFRYVFAIDLNIIYLLFPKTERIKVFITTSSDSINILTITVAYTGWIRTFFRNQMRKSDIFNYRPCTLCHIIWSGQFSKWVTFCSLFFYFWTIKFASFHMLSSMNQ